MNKGLKRLLNKPETLTHERLKNICEIRGAQVFAKPRTADVLDIADSGISNAEYGYALRSHFDFVVTDERADPLFAIEFDGPSHGSEVTQVRDRMKNRLCKSFGLPLLRIDSGYLIGVYRGWDLLTWITEAWFFERDWRNAQRDGTIPYDEPFIPCNILYTGSENEQFPFWFSAPAQIAMRNLYEEKQIRLPIPGMLTVLAEERDEAIGWLRINDTAVAVSSVSLCANVFAMPTYDLVDQLILCGVYDKIEGFLNGTKRVATVTALHSILEKFKARNRSWIFSGMDDPYLNLHLSK